MLIKRPLIWVFAAMLLVWYGFGVADTLTTKAVLPDSYDICSISGKITGITEKEEYNQIFLTAADVTGEDEAVRQTGIMLYVPKDFSCMVGDVLWMRAKLSEIESAENPGEFDQKAYYASKNIYYKAAAEEICIKAACNNMYLKGIFALKKRLKESYLAIADEHDSGVCISIVLGDKSILSDELKTIFQDNGIAHVLAISGLHISLIGMTLYRLLRRCGISFGISAAGSVFVMLSYGIMTGNSISTIRAIVMFAMTVYAQVLGRTYDSISALCLSAIIIMIRYPNCMLNSGFYLSFGAVLGIVVLYPAVQQLFPVKNRLAKAFLVSMSVSLATLPVIMKAYYEIPVYSVVLNLIVVPLMGLLMASAILAGVAGMFWRPVGIFLIGPASYVIRLYEWLCGITAKLPMAEWITGAPKLSQIVVYYLLLAAVVGISAAKNAKKFSLPVGKIVAVLAIVVLFWRQNGGLQIVMLSVGQGDCMYIACKDYRILIDGGSSSKSAVGTYTILPFLKYMGVRKLDYVVLTHPDSDHYSGLLELMQDRSIGTACFVMADIEQPDEAYQKIYAQAGEWADTVRTICAEQTLLDDDIVITCIHPAQHYSYTSVNDYSIALLIQYGNFDMITTGDMEQSGEKSVLELGLVKNVEVLKCGHHGSSTSTAQEWLWALKPQVALISCGKNNRYGHPHAQTMENLRQAGADAYISYENGAVFIETDGKKFNVLSYKK